MAEADLKVIENHIKDLLFKNNQTPENCFQSKFPTSLPNFNSRKETVPLPFGAFQFDSAGRTPVDRTGTLSNISIQNEWKPLPFASVNNNTASSSEPHCQNVLGTHQNVLNVPPQPLPFSFGTLSSADHEKLSRTDQNVANVPPLPFSFGSLSSADQEKLLRTDQNVANVPPQPAFTAPKSEPKENVSSSGSKKKAKKPKKTKAKFPVTDKITPQSSVDLDLPVTVLKNTSANDSAKKKSSSGQNLEECKKVEVEMTEKSRASAKIKKDKLPVGGIEYSLILKKNLKFNCYVCKFESISKESVHRHLNSKNHRDKKEEMEMRRMLPHLPLPLTSQVDAISELLNSCYKANGLRSEDLLKRKELTSKMSSFADQCATGCRLEMVGSSMSGLGLKSSKLDLVLQVPKGKCPADTLESLFTALRLDSSYLDVVSDFKTKRPRILFTDKGTQLSCGILIESNPCVKMAQLLAAYRRLDPRVPVLGAAVRQWAQLCSLDSPDAGTLPSFSFSLLLVYFLQQVQPPVLPVLHEVKNFSFTAEFLEEYIKSKQWKSRNSDSVGQLWLEFFYFYNFTYKMGKHVVCIRTSKKVSCSEKKWSTKFYAIEDPLVRRNIAHVIPNFEMCHYISHCFLTTYRYFAYPQLKHGKVDIDKNSSHLVESSEGTYGGSLVDDESSEESCTSDNEDSSLLDELSSLQDFEDNDPELDIGQVISTIRQMDMDGQEPEEKKKKKNKERESPAKEKTRPSVTYTWNTGKNKHLATKDFRYRMVTANLKTLKDVPKVCKHCKTSGHLKQNCPGEESLRLVSLPSPTPEFSRFLSKALYCIRDRNIVTDDDRDFVLEVMLDIEKSIREIFPEARLKMFGSFCNGFGFRNKSDMDFCLTFKGQDTSKNLDYSETIEKIAAHLRNHPRLDNIVSVTSAKVPIVKFVCQDTGLEGDISLYNTLAITNTEMLQVYCNIDPRVQVLGFALKYFAKVLGICDASRGSLNSYAYILMVIFFLQQRRPPVIPVLQELFSGEKPSELIEDCDVWFLRDLEKLDQVWPECGKNFESVGDLWMGLLRFYAYDFDWREYVVSIRQKTPLTRFKKFWITDQLAIEDPFDLSHNLGAGLSRKMNMYILKTFVRGLERIGSLMVRSDFHTLAGSEINYLFDRQYLNCGVEPPHDRGCRNCGKIGHKAKNCTTEKACSYCRKTGHLMKNCPQKRKNNNIARERKQDKLTNDNSVYNRKSKAEIPPQNPMNNFYLAHSSARLEERSPHPVHRRYSGPFDVRGFDVLPKRSQPMQVAPPPGFQPRFSNPRLPRFGRTENGMPPRFTIPSPMKYSHLSDHGCVRLEHIFNNRQQAGNKQLHPLQQQDGYNW